MVTLEVVAVYCFVGLMVAFLSPFNFSPAEAFAAGFFWPIAVAIVLGIGLVRLWKRVVEGSSNG